VGEILTFLLVFVLLTGICKLTVTTNTGFTIIIAILTCSSAISATGLYFRVISLAVYAITFSFCTAGDHTDSPTLPECLRFRGKDRQINIPQEIGTKYYQFGIFLLEDSTGTRIKAIEYSYHGDAERIKMEVLNEWIGGRGKHPVTWSTLVKVLFDIELDALAAEIAEVKCQTTEQRELFGEQILMCKVVYPCTVLHQIAGLVCYNLDI